MAQIIVTESQKGYSQSMYQIRRPQSSHFDTSTFFLDPGLKEQSTKTGR